MLLCKFLHCSRSYRFPMSVVRVRILRSGEMYPICPRCGICLDREYMSFCDCCGQMLSWRLFPFARVIKDSQILQSPPQ